MNKFIRVTLLNNYHEPIDCIINTNIITYAEQINDYVYVYTTISDNALICEESINTILEQLNG